MKNAIIGYFIGGISGIIIGSFTLDANKIEPERIYIPYEVDNKSATNELAATKELLLRTKDSLNAYKIDTTISAELFIAKYKLERIRYYNEIAAKGNNIKFLRSWINRVLNE